MKMRLHAIASTKCEGWSLCRSFEVPLTLLPARKEASNPTEMIYLSPL
jgi:hypothetical protein